MYILSDCCSWTPYVRHVSGIDVAVKKGKVLTIFFSLFLRFEFELFSLPCMYLSP